VANCGFAQIIVVANPAHLDQFQTLKTQFYFDIALQNNPSGTWAALQIGLSIARAPRCIVINADQPLITEQLLKKLLLCQQYPCALVTTILSDPTGYGRIIRNAQGEWTEIIEEKELPHHLKHIVEVNAGVYLLSVPLLQKFKPIASDRTGELYLTSLWNKQGLCGQTMLIDAQASEVQGINTWADFEKVEQYYYQKQRALLAQQGVILQHCQSIMVDDAHLIKAAPGVQYIGPAHLKGSIVCEAGVAIKAFTTVDSGPTHFGSGSIIGPYAFIQSQVQTEQQVQIGAFTEVKRSTIGACTKAKHFSYIADAQIGSESNIGAFVVFCNYDGLKKYRTTVGNGVFLGSSSQLIAPVMIGHNSYIGAGTTVTHDVAPERLITRRAPWRDRALSKGENLCVGLSEG
jgi:bifunctional UDP-N-acetylglucosamine pyrophosphorylase/glucosamine-1-phosphate N-acetyltransferase